MSNLSKQVEKLEVIVNRLEKLLEELATLGTSYVITQDPTYKVGDFPPYGTITGDDCDVRE